MKNKFFLLVILMSILGAIDCHSQSVHKGRVAIYMDINNSSYKDTRAYKNIRSSFHNIIESYGFEVAPDSTAAKMAADFRKSNATRTGTKQRQSKTTDSLYIFSLDILSEYVQLSVSVIDNEGRKETQNKQRAIPKSLFHDNIVKSTELLTFEVAASLGLVQSETLMNQLASLRMWESDTMSEKLSIIDAERNKYTAMSFLPPLNQFRSHTPKGRANGIAILSGYGVSIGSFIWCTTSYQANKRKLNSISVDLSESAKAREHYRTQMDICRGGQIASGILFVGTYIYGVANSLANRGVYQKGSDKELSVVPAAYENGAGIALVYRF